MIETKFKQTELGPIPEDWAISLIADLGDYGLNNTLSRDNLSYDVGRINNIHYGDILTIYDNYIDCAKDCLPLIIPSKEPKNKFYLYSGDLIIADTAEDETVGKACEIINIDDRLVVSGLHTIVFRPKSAFAPKFLGYTFNATFHHNSLVPLMQGTKVISITKRGLNGISLAYPPNISEQEQIAETLSDVDDLIHELDALIEKKQAIFQGSMQELLTGNHRLPGFSKTWREITIEEICKITTGNSNTQDQIESGPYPFYIRSSQIMRSNRYLFDCEGVVTIGDGQIGKVFHYVSGKFDLHQRCYLMYDFNDVNVKFFYYLFSYFFYDRAIALSAKATVDSVRRDMIAKMNLDIPKIEEQNAIADILSEMDAEIAELEAKREKYKAIRQGMMQQLLTGKIRLI